MTNESSGSTISTQIDDILAKRHRNVAAIDDLLRRAESMRSVLSELDSQREEMSILLSTEKNQLLASLLQTCQSATQQLQSLRERFSRPHLTLLCIGRARQGKSRMLQTLTGLTDREIPTGRLGHCTGTTIEVFHDDGRPRAEIHKYTESAFLRERVVPFYEDFSLNEQAPTNLDEFLAQKLPDEKNPAAFIGQKNAESQLLSSRYVELYRIQQRLPLLRKYLTGKTDPVTIEELKRWVSYPDARTGIADASADFCCLAVRNARAFVEIPLKECQKVRVFDTPGLDSHSSGDFDSLARLLDNEADAGLVTRLPSPRGDAWMASDSQLLDEINKRLDNGVSLSEIVMVVLNEVRGNDESNEQQCAHVRNEALRYGIAPARVVIADCSDRDSLQSNVIRPLLERLVNNCPEQDEKRLTRPLVTLQDVAREASSLLEQLAESARTAAARIDPDDHFLAWLDDGQKKLTSGLRLLKVDAGQNRQNTDQEFLEDVRRVAEKANNEIAVPSPQEIYDFIMRNRRVEVGTAFDYFMQKLRSELAAMFGLLRNDLGRSVIEHLRSRSLQVVEQTGITRVVKCGTSESMFRQLAELADRSGGVPQLATSFRMLADFRIHFPHFLATIWKVLEEFEPNLHIVKLCRPVRDESNADKIDSASVPMLMCQQVAKALADLKKRAIHAITRELTKIASLPFELSWALICDVHDRLVIAEGIDAEWKLFLRHYRQQLMSQKQYDLEAERQRLLGIESLSHQLKGKVVAMCFSGDENVLGKLVDTP